MNYNNEKLNITIEKADYFEIKEFDNYVELYVNEILKFRIYENSTVYAYGKSTVNAYENSTVYAYNNSTVYAYDNSTVYAYSNSTVNAYDNSTVYAYNNSAVYAYSNSTVYATQFSCIHQLSVCATITQENHFGAIIGQVFEVTKNTFVYKKLQNNLIATLKLIKGQVFQSENHSKCRTDRALVVSIESIDKTKQYDYGYSQNDESFKYEVGKVVSAKYDEKIEECSTGIHFFLTRKEAEEY